MGYRRNRAAVCKRADAANVTRHSAANWLAQPVISQINFPPPKIIQYAHFDVSAPNAVHQQIFCFYLMVLLKLVDVNHAHTNIH